MKYILCVDQGTTSTKAFLLDEEGNLTKGTHVPFQQYYPQPGWVSHDAEEIYVSVLKAIAMLLAGHPESKGKISCMGITNQRETTVAFAPSGEPYTKAIVWQCRRTSDICRRPEIRLRSLYHLLSMESKSSFVNLTTQLPVGVPGMFILVSPP